MNAAASRGQKRAADRLEIKFHFKGSKCFVVV